MRWIFIKENVKVFTEEDFSKHLTLLRTCTLLAFSRTDIHKALGQFRM